MRVRAFLESGGRWQPLPWTLGRAIGRRGRSPRTGRLRVRGARIDAKARRPPTAPRSQLRRFPRRPARAPSAPPSPRCRPPHGRRHRSRRPGRRPGSWRPRRLRPCPGGRSPRTPEAARLRRAEPPEPIVPRAAGKCPPAAECAAPSESRDHLSADGARRTGREVVVVVGGGDVAPVEQVLDVHLRPNELVHLVEQSQVDASVAR